VTQLHHRFVEASNPTIDTHRFLLNVALEKFTEAAEMATPAFTLMYSEAHTLVQMVRCETETCWKGITNHSVRYAYCGLLNYNEARITTTDVLRGVKTRDDALVLQFALCDQENFVTALAIQVIRDFTVSARGNQEISEENKCMNQLLAKECMTASPQQMIIKLLQPVDQFINPCSKFYPQILSLIMDRLSRRHPKIYLRALQYAYDLRHP